MRAHLNAKHVYVKIVSLRSDEPFLFVKEILVSVVNVRKNNPGVKLELVIFFFAAEPTIHSNVNTKDETEAIHPRMTTPDSFV